MWDLSFPFLCNSLCSPMETHFFAVVNLELPPLCSAKNRPGKPSEQALVIDEYLNQIAHRFIGFHLLSPLFIGPTELTFIA